MDRPEVSGRTGVQLATLGGRLLTHLRVLGILPWTDTRQPDRSQSATYLFVPQTGQLVRSESTSGRSNVFPFPTQRP